MTSDDADQALIEAALAGSVAAWEKLVRRYEGRIYNYGLRLTGNASDALDLMQEVFLGVYRNLHRFRGDARFSSWIFRIAHNKAVDMNRRNLLLRGHGFGGDEDPFAGIDADSALEPDWRLAEEQRNAQIQTLLARLPLEQRLTVELKIFQALTFEEIARLQEISENTAKTRFYTALRKLKSIMEESHVLP
ncbi:MAG: sigma-70 family RNA polymerase sigma factor [Gammaproteobacteria bacterium]|nr:sigma-70 family RNA polymerase sigma factor [Pseudomonadales bacterium]MCP5346657.1 sigma-70 family RNA polymerase sigma factor [Pseudomonadales bacterium]